MTVVSVDEFLNLMGQTVSSTSHLYAVCVDIFAHCKKYEMDEDVTNALETLKRYFNEVN